MHLATVKLEFNGEDTPHAFLTTDQKIMSISDEIQKLDQLRRDGTLSSEEFELAKRQVLGGTHDAADSDQLEDIKLQNEVAQLDREWELAREDYLVSGRYGARHFPSKVNSVLGAVAMVAFGIFWSSLVASIPAPGFVSLVGYGIILFAVYFGISRFMKAHRYEEDQARYKRRRKVLLSKKH